MPLTDDTVVNQNDNATSEVAVLQQKVVELEHQLEWFKKQLFGSKSEKRLEEHPDQLRLFGKKQAPEPQEQPKQNNHLRTWQGQEATP